METLLSFAKRFKHPAWGMLYSKQIYELSLHLAKLENIVLIKIAYLHDAGAFKPYKQSGVES